MVAVDEVEVHVEGPTSRIVTVAAGTTESIEDLVPGTYTVALEGLTAGEVESFGETRQCWRRSRPEYQRNCDPAFVGTGARAALASTVTSGQDLSVQFPAVTGAVGYRIEWATSAGFMNPESMETASASAAITLTSVGTYYFRIRAKDRFRGTVDRARHSGPVTVMRAPEIVLMPTGRSFNATFGGANPPSQTVNVTNGGGGTLSGLGTSVAYQPGQPTGWLTRSLSATTAPATLTLSPITGSLAVGSYWQRCR